MTVSTKETYVTAVVVKRILIDVVSVFGRSLLTLFTSA